jgi:hypothetical protein
MDSHASKYEFKTNEKNDVVSAIFPLKEVLKEDNRKRERLGGSPSINIITGGARFEGLGVPAGLYLTSKEIDFQTGGGNVKTKKDNEILDNELFDKLFGKIAVIRKGGSNNVSKRNNSKTVNKSTRKLN